MVDPGATLLPAAPTRSGERRFGYLFLLIVALLASRACEVSEASFPIAVSSP